MSLNEIDQPTNKRPNYFAGQYLLEDDFQLEQQYHIDRQRRHNRILHISGIAEGLNISNASGLAVDVSAGTAIDNQGRQIVLLGDLSSKSSNPNPLNLVDNDVADPQIVTADKKIKDGEYILSVGYHHELSKTDQQDKEEFSSRRLLEIPQLKLNVAAPANFIKLAKLTINNNVVTKVDSNVREYSGLRLPSPDGQISLSYKSDEANSVPEFNSSLRVRGKLDIQGDIRAGNSDIYFTKTDHNHTGIGNTAGNAAIENAANYDALMILGRAGTSKGRYVKLWDYLQVNGGLDITGNVGIGTTNPTEKLEVVGNVKITGERLKSANGWGIVETNKQDWLRINPDESYPAISLHKPVAIGTGGLAIGEWTKPAQGELKVTQSAYLATAGGNVGIGTTSPSEKLEVSGNIKATGSITGNSLSVTGNVGIGTEKKDFKLTVGASENHLQIRREKTEKTGGKVVFIELFQEDTNQAAVPEVYPSIRFHHSMRYWHRIEARPDGLHFKTGDPNSDAYTRIFAEGAIVTGMILMWSGKITEIPASWALCDGQNGTPDLRDKFLVGVGNQYKPNDKGEGDKHRHPLSGIVKNGITENAGQHEHSITRVKHEDEVARKAGLVVQTINPFYEVTSNTSGASGNHNHSFSVDLQNQQTVEVNAIRPPWYALCFIIKL